MLMFTSAIVVTGTSTTIANSIVSRSNFFIFCLPHPFPINFKFLREKWLTVQNRLRAISSLFPFIALHISLDARTLPLVYIFRKGRSWRGGAIPTKSVGAVYRRLACGLLLIRRINVHSEIEIVPVLDIIRVRTV
jgi:hypothetical protein